MKKLTRVLFFLLAFFALLPITQVHAANKSCSNFGIRIIEPSPFPQEFNELNVKEYTRNGDGYIVTIHSDNFIAGSEYSLRARARFGGGGTDRTIDEETADATGKDVTFYIDDEDFFRSFTVSNIFGSTTSKEIFWELRGSGISSNDGVTEDECDLVEYVIISAAASISCELRMSQENNGETFEGCFERRDATVSITNCTSNGQPYNGKLKLINDQGILDNTKDIDITNGSWSGTFPISSSEGDIWQLRLVHPEADEDIVPPIEISVEENCTEDFDPVISNSESGIKTDFNFELCEQIPNKTPRAACTECWHRGEIWTAIGCISYDPTEMISTLMKVGLSISGGVALLMILAAGFMFSTSQGDPKKVSEAKELMTSAVVGLLFIIFSVTILQFIGVTLLQIPGFGG